MTIPRARKVHQSFLTAPITTLYSLAFCIWHMSLLPLFTNPSQPQRFADLILMNGPGSCVPICLAAFLPRVRQRDARQLKGADWGIDQILGLPAAKLIYVESFARVSSLSLSAKLVRLLVDRFFVQWPEVQKRQSVVKRSPWLARIEYHGWLV